MFQTSKALFKKSAQKNRKTICRDQSLSLFHRFLNAKFSSRLYFTWKTHHVLFSSSMLYYNSKDLNILK